MFAEERLRQKLGFPRCIGIPMGLREMQRFYFSGLQTQHTPELNVSVSSINWETELVKGLFKHPNERFPPKHQNFQILKTSKNVSSFKFSLLDNTSPSEKQRFLLYDPAEISFL